MAWKQLGPPPTSLEDNIVSVPRKREKGRNYIEGLRFGARASRKHGLNKYKTVDGFVDGHRLGLRFRDDDEGKRRLIKEHDNNSGVRIACSDWIKRIPEASEGRWRFKMDANGFAIIDFKHGRDKSGDEIPPKR